MELQTLQQSILIMAVIIGIGSLIGYRQPLTADSRQLVITIIINVAMPCIILDGIFQTTIDQQILYQIFAIFFISIILNCLGIFIGWLGARALPLPVKKRREIALLSGLGNTGFIGLPLCAALFGPKGALLAAIFDAGVDVVLWTVGVMMLQEKGSFSLKGLKTLINIPMIAIVFGLGSAIIGFVPPEPVKQLFGTLSKLASPLAMMYIGMLLPMFLRNKPQVSLKLLSMPLTFKLVVFPLMTAFLLSVFSIDSEIVSVSLVQVAMPTLTLASILFGRYAADEEMGAMTTVCSTLLALLSIPVVLVMGNWLLH
ncbi:AEC family transporter [Brevibacillus brevis]|uniref:AEC family transporter n=2 Tax=Brevibacillus brevis TaxID=1393 RepID=UPI000B364EDB|nr:AEC family transporter [Brevibacillus brevis]OUQ88249.1 permease [Brevibacillus brevis]WJQ80123.1 AEC family transporter [Brevibacillus brevis]